MMKLTGVVGVLLSVLAAGCASSDKSEGQKLEDSGYLLYPLTKLGEGIEALGNGFQIASQPVAWSNSRPPAVGDDAVSDEQDAYLDSISVPVEFDSEVGPHGLGAGAYAFGPPVRDALLRVERVVGRRFDWRMSPMIQDVAVAYPGGVVVVNPNVMGSLSSGAQYLFLFHEAGHHVLGHTSQAGMVSSMQQPWLSPAREQAADAFAGDALVRMGATVQQAAYAALDAFKSNPPQGTPRHPPRDVRVGTVRQAAAQAATRLGR